jgi:hypothetical protein
MDIVTLKRLNKAFFQIQTELEQLGFYDERLEAVDVYLVTFGSAYGWHYYGTSGDINIPAISFGRILDLFGRPYKSLRDILRHEFAHAVADTHRGLIRSSRFSDAFGASHESSIEWEFDPDCHLTQYAATCPSEDFAETFMFYVRHRGVLPVTRRTPAISRKWSYIHSLGNAIARGQRRWSEPSVGKKLSEQIANERLNERLNIIRDRVIAAGRATPRDVDSVIYDMVVDDFRRFQGKFLDVSRVDFKPKA